MKKYITQLGIITLLVALCLGASSIPVLAQHAHPAKDPYNKPDIWSKIEQSPHEMALWTEYMGKSWQNLSYNERLKVKMWIQDMWLNQLSTKNAVTAVVEEGQDTQEEDIVEKTIVKEESQKQIQEEIVKTTAEVIEETKEETNTQKEELVQVAVKTIPVEKITPEDKVEETKEEVVKTNVIDRSVEERKEVHTGALTTQKLTRQSLAFDVAERNPIYQKVLEKPKVRVFIKDLTEVVLAEPMDMEELKEDLFGNFLIIEDYYKESFAEYKIEYVYYAQKYPLGGFSEARWVSRHDQQLKALKAKRLNMLKRKFLDKQLTASTN